MRKIARLAAIGFALGLGCWLTLFLVRVYIVDAHSANPQRALMYHAGDFPVFYAAGKMALEGSISEVYQSEVLSGRFDELTGRQGSKYRFPYPPTALFLFAPFAVLAPITAVVLWQVTWWALLCATCYNVIRRKSAFVFSAGFPAVAYNAYCGQNGAVTGILFTLAAGYFYRSPVISGMALGMLSYKPHFALLPILVAVLSRNWKMLWSAFLTFLIVTGLSVLAFGPDAWKAFFRDALTQAESLQDGDLKTHQISSFMAARAITDNLFICYSITVAVAVIAALMVCRIWRTRSDDLAPILSMAAAMPLVTPYANNYDLAILAAPFALACKKIMYETEAFWRNIAVIPVLALLPFLNSPGFMRLSPFPLAPVCLMGIICLCYYSTRLDSISREAIEPGT